MEFLRRLRQRGHHLLQPHQDTLLVQPRRDHPERTLGRREHHSPHRGRRRAEPSQAGQPVDVCLLPDRDHLELPVRLPRAAGLQQEAAVAAQGPKALPPPAAHQHPDLCGTVVHGGGIHNSNGHVSHFPGQVLGRRGPQHPRVAGEADAGFHVGGHGVQSDRVSNADWHLLWRVLLYGATKGGKEEWCEYRKSDGREQGR